MKKNIILFFGILGLGVSCTRDFENLNTDRDAITQTSASAEMMLPNVLFNLADLQITGNLTLGGVVSQQVTYLLYNTTDRYLWQADDRYWNAYNQIENLNDIERFGIRDNRPQYKAVSLILRAYLYTMLADAYGPVPFSEAGKSSKNIFKPAYESEQDIYKGCLEMLKEANNILKQNTGSITGDQLYKGDTMKWRKFANSLQLRMLLKMSTKVNVIKDFTSIVNNPSEYPIFSSNADQAVYQYPDTGNQVSPFSIGRGRAYEVLQLTAMPEFMKNLLDKYQDPRLHTWFDRPSATPNAPYKASPAGATNGDYANVSMLDLSFYSDSGKLKGIFMNYSELMFILAEAAEKGWIGESAKIYYENGVRASFDFWQVPMPSDYLTKEAAYNGTNPKLIAEQKYLAQFMNGFEAWNDFKRNHLISLAPAENNQNNNRIPNRLKYPSIEQSVNPENYQKAVSKLGADDINAKIWWQP